MREGNKQVYFFDTSALVKRYHRELGTHVVDAAFGNKDATRTTSDLSVIEFYSAMANELNKNAPNPPPRARRRAKSDATKLKYFRG